MGRVKRKSLRTEIYTRIRKRILFAFMILATIIIFQGAYQFNDAFSNFKKSIKYKAIDLEDFTISQLLINNNAAIDLKLKSYDGIGKIEWKDTKESGFSDDLNYIFPFEWAYVYQLREIGDETYGHFLIHGTISDFLPLFSIAFSNLFFLVIFCVLIIFFLMPLSKEIPNRLILEPINNLLELFKSDKKQGKELVSSYEEINELYQEATNIQGQKIKNAELREQLQREEGELKALKLTMGILAHDLKKPLSRTKSILQSLERVNYDLEVIKDAKDSTISNINRVTSMIKEIEDYSNDNIKIQKSICSLSRLIDDSLGQILAANRDRDISIEKDLLHKHAVNVDKHRIQRVLSNIFSNAIEAIFEMGAKSKGRMAISSLEQSGKVLLRISNNGPQIAENDINNIFNPYFTKGKKEGKGLGLVSARKVLELQDGSISVRNIEQGVEFEIQLPISAELEIAEDLKAPDTPESIIEEKNKTQRLLLVEDDPVFQTNILLTLKNSSQLSHIKLDWAKSLQEARSFLQDNEYTHIIFDKELTNNENGFTIIEELKSKNINLSTAIYSTSLNSEDYKRARELKVKKILPKPLDEADLFGFILM